MIKLLSAATVALIALGFAAYAGAEEVKTPRDAASGQASGKRQHMGTDGAAGEGSETGAASEGVVSPRDAASGLPTGKRQHKPVTVRKEIDKSSPAMATTADADGDGAAEVSHEVKSPRDAASGQATGKRQHTPVRVATGDVNGDGTADAAVQDHNSSRSNKSASAVEPDGEGGTSDGQAGAQPQTYKAKQGKTGSAK